MTVLMENKGDGVRQVYQQALCEIPGPHAEILGGRRDHNMANFAVNALGDEDTTPKEVLIRNARKTARDAHTEARSAKDPS